MQSSMHSILYQGGDDMLKYDELNELLVLNFDAMKEAFDYFCTLGGCNTHGLYACEFVPFIIEQLEKGNDRELKRAFEVIEHIYAHGDRECLYVANVSIAEPLYNLAFDKYSKKIISLCGPVSRKEFAEMLD